MLHRCNITVALAVIGHQNTKEEGDDCRGTGRREKWVHEVGKEESRNSEKDRVLPQDSRNIGVKVII